ncbi:hypothetical protein N8463_02770 [Synechococcus sp. AH-601-P06]|nr:hypothetical protein [Synechococcus sp. AH-601-P06]
MNRAYTFTPEVNDDGSYDVENGSLSSGHRGGTIEPSFIEDEVSGERHYQITEEDFQQDEDYVSDIDDDYITAIHDLYPNLSLAQEFAANNWTEEDLQTFNNLMDVGELGEIMEAIEKLMEDFDASGFAPEEAEEEPEVEQEEFDDAVSQLLEEEPQGDETAYEWLNAAVEFQDASPVFSAVAAQTAAFHRGEISQSEAISNLLERYSIAELAPIYKHLTSN